MATDSTELTFVRCPACRSLVPAMSTRCRMCGASLDPVADGEQAKDPTQNESRARHKTIVHGQEVSTAPDDAPSPEELAAGKAAIQASEAAPGLPEAAPIPPAAPTPPPAAPTPPPAASMEPVTPPAAASDDPLGAFIEEVEVPSEPVARAPEPPKPPRKSDEAKPLMRAKPTPTEVKEPDPLGLNEPEAVPEKPLTPLERSSGQTTPSKVITETGRGTKRGGLSFSKKAPEDKQAVEAKKESPKPAKRAPKAREEQPRPSKRQTSQRQETAPEQKRKAKSPAKDVKQKKRPKPQKQKLKPVQPVEHSAVYSDVQEGVLVGWFVRIDDEQRTPIELYSGKRLVSSASLRENDLIIDDDSISTPHAMLLATEGGLVQIQDLMSDAGLFLQRAGEGEFESVEQAENLAHGDVVRFGNVSFIVTLIPVY